MSTDNQTQEGLAPNASEVAETLQDGISAESFLAMFGENTDQTATSPEAEESASEAQTSADESEDEDFSISFSEQDDAEEPNLTEFITSKVEDPEVKAAFESLVSDFQNKEAGFTKLHEQVTTVKEIAGVQSLTEVAKHYQEFVIPWSEVLANAASDDVEARDAAIKSMLKVAADSSGLSIDEIYNIAEGIDAPPVKPASPASRDQALQVLGLTEESLTELHTMKERAAFAEKWGKNIAKVSEQLGFTLDPGVLFDIKKQNPGIKDEAAILMAYPTEYKKYLVTKGSNIAMKREKVNSAPSLGGKGATATNDLLTSKEDILRAVTSSM